MEQIEIALDRDGDGPLRDQRRRRERDDRDGARRHRGDARRRGAAAGRRRGPLPAGGARRPGRGRADPLHRAPAASGCRSRRSRRSPPSRGRRRSAARRGCGASPRRSTSGAGTSGGFVAEAQRQLAGLESEPAARLLPGVRRAVREPAARDAAALDRGAAGAAC